MRIRDCLGWKGRKSSVKVGKPGSSRRWSPVVEGLEARTVLSLAFNFSLSDPSSVLPAADQPKFFNSLRWASDWATEGLYGLGTIDVQVNILSLDSTTLARTSGPYRVYSDGATTDLWERYSQYETRTGDDANGSNADMLIEINADYLTNRYQSNGQPTPNKFWLDPNYYLPGPVSEPPTPLPSTQYDFLSVMSHEILHGLGISNGFGPDPSLSNKTRYDQNTMVSGSDAWFTGQFAREANSGNFVALRSTADLAHLQNPNDLMYYAFAPGERRLRSAIDMGILRDLGWTTGTARFNVAASMVSENVGSVLLTVTRNNGTYPGWINYSLGGTASLGVDYGVPGSSMIYFAPGQLVQTISVPIYDDGVVDGPKYFDMTLYAADNSTLVPDVTGATSTRVTIVSNEKRPGNAVSDDFDNDGKSDMTVFGANASGIYGFTTLLSSQNFDSSRPVFFAMGFSEAIPTVADYDGDGRADYSVYAPNGVGGYSWYWYSSVTGVQGAVHGFGFSAVVPLTGDFDGDGKSDFSVYGPSGGIYGFSTLLSSRNFDINQQSGFNSNGAGFGFAQSQPLAGDFDGDGKDDYSLYTPNGLGGYSWLWISSLNGSQGGVDGFGFSGVVPLTGDFDGDGKSDFSVYGPSGGIYGFSTLLSSRNFDINQQSGFNFDGLGYGWSGAIPSVGDYDGDGKSDYSLFSPVAWPGDSVFTYIASTNNYQYGYALGTANSLPVSAPFITLYRKVRGLA